MGAWASILFIKNNKILLKGVEINTTHNRMELQAVIKAIDYLNENNLCDTDIIVYSDSQYVVNLTDRQQKLANKNFITKKGKPIQNNDLVQLLLNQINNHNITLIKVAAHKKDGNVFNKEVDIIVRKLVREKVNENVR